MPSIPARRMPSEADCQSIRNELEGNVFRGVAGFVAKYFEAPSWSVTVVEKVQEIESGTIGRKLSVEGLGLTHFGALVEWLDTFQSQVFAADHDNFQSRFHAQPISEPGRALQAGIYLESSRLPRIQAVAGNTRVFGEYHHQDAPVMAEDGSSFLHFCARTRQLFAAQPARSFLHAFLVCGTTLELWVFDRSGAYSSEKLNLSQRPQLLLQTLAAYTMISDEESGFNTFVKRLEPGLDSYVTFDQRAKLYLQPELIATPDYIVGLGTTCYTASGATTGEPSTVVKFSWRADGLPAELKLLKRARERNVYGVIRLLGDQDLVSIADIRHGLHFPQPFVNRTFSCVATAPLGRPIQKFTSIHELLDVLCDLVKALRSLYVDGGMLHRDIAIKNLVITSEHSMNSLKGLLIDFDQALDLDNVLAFEPLKGSDGFMAIGILSGKRHTYRHDLESLFYVFLWFAIGNDHEHDDANEILKGLPKSSRLWKWCSMNFRAVGQAKVADMSPEGFVGILTEFSTEFAPLRGLAKELHTLIFPVRDGQIFTGTETEQIAIERLYGGMADAFHRSALTFQDC
ncbi:hypothetical protein B7494_g5113 [Chlorociboria aeruginascens]|nr:hypothetical protein B7494_g5113 [Chlorociboria aeruginascens]